MQQGTHVNADFTKLKHTPFHVKSHHLQKHPKKKKLTIEKTKVYQQTVKHKCAFGLDTWPEFTHCPWLRGCENVLNMGGWRETTWGLEKRGKCERKRNNERHGKEKDGIDGCQTQPRFCFCHWHTQWHDQNQTVFPQPLQHSSHMDITRKTHLSPCRRAGRGGCLWRGSG